MGTSITLRVDRPDGTAAETHWSDDGALSVVRFGCDGQVEERFAVAVDDRGDVVVQGVTADGRADTVAPDASEELTNPYGAFMARRVYDGLVTVVTNYDDEGRPRSVSLRGAWGDHTLDVRPDGARTLSWEVAGDRGRQSWDPAGELERYEATFADGSRYQWQRSHGRARAEMTGWDGTTRVVDGAPTPIGEVAAR